MATASDDFNRADSTGLGANWTAPGALTTQDIVSNTAKQHNAGANEAAYWNAASFGADQFSQATILSSPFNNFWYVTARGASGAFSAYGGGCSFGAFGDTLAHIVKIVAGVETSLAVHASQSLAVNDVVRLEVVTNGANDDLALIVNSTQILTVSVTSVYASGQPGIACKSAGNQSQFDDWSGGDLAPTIVVPVLYHQRIEQGLS